MDAEFKRRNEKVKLAVVNFTADKFREATTATDAEVGGLVRVAQERLQDSREAQDQVRADQHAGDARTAADPAADVQKQYKDNQQQYSTPEQVRASHILFKTEGKDEAAVRKQAEAVLARAKAGEDFAKLANEFTEEEVGKTRGGDLDFFGRGQMAKEFEEAAFALKPGQISDIVKTSVRPAHHQDHRPQAGVDAAARRGQEPDRGSAEVGAGAGRSAAARRRARQADRRSGRLRHRRQGARADRQPSPASSRKDEPIVGLGMAPAVAERAFEMKQGETSKAIRTPQGFAFISLTGTQPERLPALDEVKARVRDDVVKSKAADTARQRAAAVAAQLKSGNFEAAAKAAGLEVKTTEQIARGAPIGDVGINAAVDAVAFTLPAGAVSDPIRTDNGAVVSRCSSARTSHRTSSPPARRTCATSWSASAGIASTRPTWPRRARRCASTATRPRSRR